MIIIRHNQQDLFEQYCFKCGRSVYVLGKNTKIKCRCGRVMTRADTEAQLRIWRKSKGLTQEKIADMLSIGRSYYAKIESCSVPVTDDLRVKIKRLTGLIL